MTTTKSVFRWLSFSCIKLTSLFVFTGKPSGSCGLVDEVLLSLALQLKIKLVHHTNLIS